MATTSAYQTLADNAGVRNVQTATTDVLDMAASGEFGDEFGSTSLASEVKKVTSSIEDVPTRTHTIIQMMAYNTRFIRAVSERSDVIR